MRWPRRHLDEDRRRIPAAPSLAEAGFGQLAPFKAQICSGMQEKAKTLGTASGDKVVYGNLVAVDLARILYVNLGA